MFAWKLIRSRVPKRGHLTSIGVDINAECPFCFNYIEDINHLFKNCELTRKIWNTISNYCTNPINSNMSFIDWIKFIQKHEKTYDRIYRKPLEKILVIAWSI